MDKDTFHSALVTAAVLARRNPDHSAYRVANDVAALMRLAKRIQRRAEDRCNLNLTEAQQERAHRADERDYATCTTLVLPYAAAIERQGDVRGYAVKLLWDDARPGPSNSFAGDVWGIPS